MTRENERGQRAVRRTPRPITWGAVAALACACLAIPVGACAQSTLPIPEPDETVDPGAPVDLAGLVAGEQGWLGVALGMTSKDAAAAAGYAQPMVLIDIIFAGSPAEGTDFVRGDWIAAYNGTRIYDIQKLIELVKATPPGTRVTFTRVRDGKEQDVPLLLGARPELQALIAEHFIAKPAPELGAATHMGATPVRLADLEGKVVLLDFWATWCGPCRRVIPHLAELYTKHEGEGLVVIGISDEEAEAIDAFLAENAIPYIMTRDEARTSHAAYMVSALPTLFVIGRDGMVRNVFHGAGELDALDAALTVALSEKAAKPASVKPTKPAKPAGVKR